MKELPKEFEGTGDVKGFHFKQIDKTASAFFYEVTDPFNKIHWEVFKRRVSPLMEVEIDGKKVIFEEKEMYPKSKSFGCWAWCFSCRNKAMSRFRTLNKKK